MIRVITRPSLRELIGGLVANLERATEPQAGVSANELAVPMLSVLDRLANEWSSWADLLRADNEDIRQTLAPLAPQVLQGWNPDRTLPATEALEEENRALKQALSETIARLDLPAGPEAEPALAAADKAVVQLMQRMLRREASVRVDPSRVPPTSGNPVSGGLTPDALNTTLKQFLAAQMPAASGLRIEALQRLPGGASREAWIFDFRWLENGIERFEPCILMREPRASVLISDSAPSRIDGTRRTVAGEVRVVRAMRAAGLPVPDILWSDPEGLWLERPFSIARRLPGTTDVSGLIGTSAADDMLDQFVHLLARIHTLEPEAAGVAFLGTPTRESAALEQVLQFEGNFDRERLEPFPATDYLVRWLKKNAPVADRVRVIHGDYRLGNFLHENGQIIAILDWEQVHVGDPIEEIAFMYWALWSLEPVCPIETFIARYEAASGTAVNRATLAWYRAFIELKMLVVLLTGLRSYYATPERQLHYASAQTNEMIRDAQLRVIEEFARGGPSVAFDAYRKYS